MTSQNTASDIRFSPEDSSLDIAVSGWGRFHLFPLARQHEARGQLHSLLVPTPRFLLKRENLPMAKTRSNPLLHLPNRVLEMKGIKSVALRHQVFRQHRRFVARHMKGVKILHGQSGSGGIAGPELQKRGGLFICDRGSTHILWQKQVMEEILGEYGLPFHGIPDWLAEMECQEYEQADRIFIPSRFVAESFIARGVPEEKLVPVPYGVDLTRFRPTGTPPEDGFHMLFVGHFSLRKGFPLLIEAFRRLDVPGKTLTCIGPPQEELTSLIRDCASLPGLTLLPPMPQTELCDAMSRAHCMVLPSIEEGLALVQAEAMASGCPVIATRNTGAEDLFTSGKEGLIIQERTPDLLAAAMADMASDRHRLAAMREAALQKVRQIGGWDSYGQRILEACQQLAQEKQICD